MRVRNVSVDDAKTPNDLIAQCQDVDMKRYVLRHLRREWKMSYYRLALYDNDGTIVGIAFADEDGNLGEMLSPYDLEPARTTIANAVKKTVLKNRQERIQRQITEERRIQAKHDFEHDDDFNVPTDSEDIITMADFGVEPTPSIPSVSSTSEAGLPDWSQLIDDGKDETSETADSSNPYEPENPYMSQEPQGKRDPEKRHHVLPVILVILLLLIVLSGLTVMRIGPFARIADIPQVSDAISRVEDVIPSPVKDMLKEVIPDEDQSKEQDDVEQIADDQTTSFTILQGDAASNVVGALRNSGMPNAASTLYSVLASNGTASSIRPGTYLVKGSETAEQIAERIVKGQQYPDGYLGVDNSTTIRTLAEKISDGTYDFTADDFTAAASDVEAYKPDYPMMASVPDNLPSVEGFITSGTYDLSGKTAEEAVRTLLDATEKEYERSGLNSDGWFRTLTIASMLDKEILYDDEKPIVASIIDNRLAQDMPLQIDATVLYALGRDTGIPTISDTEVDSPYNTYRNKGLPIGPICSGITQTSIDAVQNHASTNYLFYCLTPENDGHHVFAETYSEHEQNVEAYRNATGQTDVASLQ